MRDVGRSSSCVRRVAHLDVAALVVGAALVGVGEYLVGVGDALEGRRVSVGLVRVELRRGRGTREKKEERERRG